jgi:RNA polymerase sigma-70 factor (ECF subfamily)
VRRIAVRESIRVAQRATKVVPIDPEAPGFAESAAAATLPDPSTVLDVRATLAALQPAHRAILVLRDLEGWTEEQVAEVLDIAPGTAKSRLHRARTAFSRRWTA